MKNRYEFKNMAANSELALTNEEGVLNPIFFLSVPVCRNAVHCVWIL